MEGLAIQFYIIVIRGKAVGSRATSTNTNTRGRPTSQSEKLTSTPEDTVKGQRSASINPCNVLVGRCGVSMKAGDRAQMKPKSSPQSTRKKEHWPQCCYQIPVYALL